MGHYYKICGRTHANEKFSGKGHKSHVCKDCSRKSNKKENTNGLSEISVQLNVEENHYMDSDNSGFDDDEELPF